MGARPCAPTMYSTSKSVSGSPHLYPRQPLFASALDWLLRRARFKIQFLAATYSARGLTVEFIIEMIKTGGHFELIAEVVKSN